MGAGMLRKKVKEAGLNHISVTNSAVNNLTGNEDLVITHRDLTHNALNRSPSALHISLTNFLNGELYQALTARLSGNSEKPSVAAPAQADVVNEGEIFRLTESNVYLGLKADNKEQAIRFAGSMLVSNGFVTAEYVDAMIEREALSSTYLGESIAVPHGTIAAKDRVLKTGVVFCQFPDGVQFGEEEDDRARLVIGIAARNDEHLFVISSLTNALDDEKLIEKLATTRNVNDVLDILSGDKAA